MPAKSNIAYSMSRCCKFYKQTNKTTTLSNSKIVIISVADMVGTEKPTAATQPCRNWLLYEKLFLTGSSKQLKRCVASVAFGDAKDENYCFTVVNGWNVLAI